MIPIRAEPRRNILIVMLLLMMSCVVDWCLTVHHQFNEEFKSLLIEFNSTRTNVEQSLLSLSLQVEQNIHGCLSLCCSNARQLNFGSDRACSFWFNSNLINANSTALDALYRDETIGTLSSAVSVPFDAQFASANDWHFEWKWSCWKCFSARRYLGKRIRNVFHEIDCHVLMI